METAAKALLSAQADLPDGYPDPRMPSTWNLVRAALEMGLLSPSPRWEIEQELDAMPAGRDERVIREFLPLDLEGLDPENPKDRRQIEAHEREMIASTVEGLRRAESPEDGAALLLENWIGQRNRRGAMYRL